MYDGLRVKFPELFKDERCPPFPAGAIFGLYNVTFIDTRRVAFEKLFQYIVSQKELKCSDKLSQFLEYSNLLKALSRQADQASQVPRHANPGAPRTSVHSDGSLDATLSFQEAILLIKSLRKERENEHAAFAEIRRLAELDFENEVQARVEESSPVCKICWLKSVEVTLVPCGHTVMCEKCATDCPGHRCPFCNVEFTQSLKVFF
ncbi:hypothetical protein CAOG_01972 [Capsaspora owczarzaki ATCC 30864]|uniref:RING-type domain-containing protein n=1 Tax=Capsaspora owczarzaki (strain ATCC 30864) TaxID=595528 RepID=A0A0D2U6D8_CAPO3|nr:hypothetical protein CAOG_01972 [Capsaspora owczarzaki ATCC 30864]KJE90706.1 hypothetical protein CAOG_001972 [Capsaspora owczarzaki ATCC 30864]KJE90707.1 hypothetical protein, variant [Capsaspora owczarzaki ATCC 30864]|eukprot:XP_004364840.2 hypothetical protein CAOG_01972 [Capsaspora owczarzaki ATCC 30864]